MKTNIFCGSVLLSVFFILIGSSFAAEDDPIKAECEKGDRPAPWCYEEKVVKLMKPELCANITKYWGSNADGVEGYCYYEIAKKLKDCSLCDKIKNTQIRQNLCNRDVCKKR